MSDRITLEQVEQLAAQLLPQEQLKLVAHITERLSINLPAMPPEEGEQERVRLAEEILRECDQAAAAFTRKTDSAETIRRMRDERLQQLCQRES